MYCGYVAPFFNLLSLSNHGTHTSNDVDFNARKQTFITHIHKMSTIGKADKSFQSLDVYRTEMSIFVAYTTLTGMVWQRRRWQKIGKVMDYINLA